MNEPALRTLLGPAGSVNDGKQAQQNQNQRIVLEIVGVQISKFGRTEFRRTKGAANLKLVADEKAIKL